MVSSIFQPLKISLQIAKRISARVKVCPCKFKVNACSNALSRWTRPGLMVQCFGMATEAPPVPRKMNLRRPDIMAAVQAQVLSHYRSDVVERIRANGNILSAGGPINKIGQKHCSFLWGETALLSPVDGPAGHSRQTA